MYIFQIVLESDLDLISIQTVLCLDRITAIRIVFHITTWPILVFSCFSFYFMFTWSEADILYL